MAHHSLFTRWRHTSEFRSINIVFITSVSGSSTSMSDSLFNSLSVAHNLLFVHYNIQSILSKLDTLYAELYEFDILAFIETWLCPAVDPTDFFLKSYCEPEWKDRPGDNHGGIIIYIEEGIHYKRREELKPRNVKCVWLELANCNRRLLFGLFYRPPSSDDECFTAIENSIALAVCLFVLRFYGPVNPMGSCRARSVYLTTRLLGRLSPLSG